ncbi:MAG: ParM/StbA family protein [Zetaproteobacteria bacterium]|nr:ParM/StbA family protein [Zetaproteobacteria bacterium]
MDTIIGIDIGFGFTKATDGKKFQVFKSIYGEAIDFQFKESLLKNNQEQDEHIHIDVDGISYFVGELAERQSANRQFTLEQTQFISSATKTLALAAISRFVSKESESFKVVVGLPIGHYRQYKDEVRKILRQSHQISITNQQGINQDTLIGISDVKVIPQPIGTVMDRLLDDVGKPSDMRFASEKIGIIDVGFSTCDYTISDKARYSERGSLTTQNGISKAFEVISSKLKDSCGINIELYRLFEAIETGSIKIRGKGYDLRKITQIAFQQLAANIASDANRIWSDDWDMDAIMITGGGGAVLAPYLQPLLEGVIIPIEQDLDYRLHNVRGYNKYGRNIWPQRKAPMES